MKKNPRVRREIIYLKIHLKYFKQIGRMIFEKPLLQWQKAWFRKKRIQSSRYEFEPEFYKSKFTFQNNVLAVILHEFRYFFFRSTQH